MIEDKEDVLFFIKSGLFFLSLFKTLELRQNSTCYDTCSTDLEDYNLVDDSHSIESFHALEKIEIEKCLEELVSENLVEKTEFEHFFQFLGTCLITKYSLKA